MTTARKLHKTIELTREQKRELYKCFHKPKAITKVLSEMLSQVAEAQIEEESAAWDSMAQLAGYENIGELQKQGFSMTLDWVKSSLDIYETPPWDAEDGQGEVK